MLARWEKLGIARALRYVTLRCPSGILETKEKAMSDERKRDAQANREKSLPVNYGGATPEEVALAVLRYRPGKKKQVGSSATSKGEKKPTP